MGEEKTNHIWDTIFDFEHMRTLRTHHLTVSDHNLCVQVRDLISLDSM